MDATVRAGGRVRRRRFIQEKPRCPRSSHRVDRTKMFCATKTTTTMLVPPRRRLTPYRYAYCAAPGARSFAHIRRPLRRSEHKCSIATEAPRSTAVEPRHAVARHL